MYVLFEVNMWSNMDPFFHLLIKAYFSLVYIIVITRANIHIVGGNRTIELHVHLEKNSNNQPGLRIILTPEEENYAPKNTERAEKNTSLLLDFIRSEVEKGQDVVKSCNEGINEMNNFMRDLHAKISTVKRNLLNLAAQYTLSETSCSTSEYMIESNIREGKTFPVGLSYRRIVQPIRGERVLIGTDKEIPRSCQEILDQGINKSGVYEIQPILFTKPLLVLCDMTTRGGGWTHIQKRFDGSVDFFQEWREYKFGFGDLGGEFWLGLENIHLMTDSELMELLVEIMDRDGNIAYAHYERFSVHSEVNGYKLYTLKGFSGNAGDSLDYHLGSKFSTRDLDQDSDSRNCAEKFEGGWWYKGCYAGNLNGKYINANLASANKYKGLHWTTFKGLTYCHAKSRMMIRPAQS